MWSLALPTDADDHFVGPTALYAHDLLTGQRQVHDFGPERHPGEFVFVPETAHPGQQNIRDASDAAGSQPES